MRGIITPWPSESREPKKAAGQTQSCMLGQGRRRGQNRGQKLSGSEKDRRISWDRSQSAWDKSMLLCSATTEKSRTDAGVVASVLTFTVSKK